MNTYKVLINGENELTISGDELVFSASQEYGDRQNPLTDSFIFENPLDNSIDNLTTIAQLENLNNELQEAINASDSGLITIKISINSLVLRQDIPLFEKTVNFLDYRKGLMNSLNAGPDSATKLLCRFTIARREERG